MALTFASVCDCGLPKRLTKTGFLICSDHCDRNACSGHCTRCTQYAAGIVRRVILRTYEGNGP